MLTTLKRIDFSKNLLILLGALVTPISFANEIILASTDGPRISIYVENKHVTARDKEKNIKYSVDDSISRHLKSANDIRFIAENKNSKTQLFIVLSREYSKPGAMGQGYCGAGYEDYILLLEMLERKLVLRDQNLIQSCLKNISMFIDQGDENPINGFTHEKDGSLSYRLIDDDYKSNRVLTVDSKRFKIFLAPSMNK